MRKKKARMKKQKHAAKPAKALAPKEAQGPRLKTNVSGQSPEARSSKMRKEKARMQKQKHAAKPAKALAPREAQGPRLKTNVNGQSPEERSSKMRETKARTHAKDNGSKMRKTTAHCSLRSLPWFSSDAFATAIDVVM